MFDIAQFVTQAQYLPRENFSWGVLQWLVNAKLLPGSQQTLGMCEILPGKKNPLHFHPNCEELLYVLAGTCKHSLDDEWVDLRPGDTIRVPVGVKHQLVNTGPVSLHCVIAFSSGDRETVFLE